jgi:hypothetical protein
MRGRRESRLARNKASLEVNHHAAHDNAVKREKILVSYNNVILDSYAVSSNRTPHKGK